MSPIIIYIVIVIAVVALVLAIVALTKKPSNPKPSTTPSISNTTFKPPVYGNNFEWPGQPVQSFDGTMTDINIGGTTFKGNGFSVQGNTAVKCLNAGLYSITYHLTLFTANDSALVYSAIFINGTQNGPSEGVVSGGSSKDTPYTLGVTFQVSLNAGDVFSIKAAASGTPNQINRVDTHQGADVSAYIMGYQIG